MEVIGSSKGMLGLRADRIKEILVDKFQDLDISKDDLGISIRLHKYRRDGSKRHSSCVYVSENLANFKELRIQAWRTFYPRAEVVCDVDFELNLERQEPEMVVEFILKPLIQNYLSFV